MVDSRVVGVVSLAQGEIQEVDLEFTSPPNKANSARMVLPVCVDDVKVTKLCVIVFQPREATGEYTEDFPEGSLDIGQQYGGWVASSGVKEFGFYPRPKAAFSEICLPIGSYKLPFDPHPGSLDNLPSTAVSVRILGVDASSSSKVTSLRSDISTDAPFVTLGTDSFSRRVGDPHTIVSYPTDRLQIAGFMAANEPDPDLLDLLNSFRPFNPYNPS